MTHIGCFGHIVRTDSCELVSPELNEAEYQDDDDAVFDEDDGEDNVVDDHHDEDAAVDDDHEDQDGYDPDYEDGDDDDDDYQDVYDGEDGDGNGKVYKGGVPQKFICKAVHLGLVRIKILAVKMTIKMIMTMPMTLMMMCDWLIR